MATYEEVSDTDSLSGAEGANPYIIRPATRNRDKVFRIRKEEIRQVRERVEALTTAATSTQSIPETSYEHIAQTLPSSSPTKTCNVISIQAISLSDIQKVLRPKPPVDPREKVPAEVLKEFRDLFSPEEVMKLPPRRPGMDHEVNLQPDKNGNKPPLPWGPLYNMSREEPLALRKTLKDLLDRGFIRASSSATATPVLFRDRYPLPLIAETLQNLAKAKWFTKLDVVAAFHRIRMAPRLEWKIAFRTRFGLYEWLVCPFGLSGAPASFQRYMNVLSCNYRNLLLRKQNRLHCKSETDTAPHSGRHAPECYRYRLELGRVEFLLPPPYCNGTSGFTFVDAVHCRVPNATSHADKASSLRRRRGDQYPPF
ncbi:reverse transcriptase (RNA-dependent DNA polymerase) [Hirsutella rhossiliensis]|uniref:Reverse transcriptase (RNA-dependent DNA polymerase) domain-containing protein n=1 Tax=Hirsutella rhossiliensis TaxID=111463 RepID=A0A9P8MM52_9HYPO|nr:reverse transcriptase (RNA-dependent DNA polymerase) domain-containing protein [Hirsutella rhossiliensis]KAH0957517.1 reverse transcriptase (RNA-dependent DNA polymerase) domain-containing protein [Hirsutella rhossiliensis]